MSILFILVGEGGPRSLQRHLVAVLYQFHAWQAIDFDTNRLVTFMGSRKLARLLPERSIKARLGLPKGKGRVASTAMPLQAELLSILHQVAEDTEVRRQQSSTKALLMGFSLGPTTAHAATFESPG